MRQHLKLLNKSSSIILSALICIGASGIYAFAAEDNSDIAKQKALVQSLEKSSKTSELSDALYDLAVKYNNSNDYVHAEEYMRRAVEVSQNLKRPEDAAKRLDTHIALAGVLSNQKKFAEAIEEYQKAVVLAKELGKNNTLPILYSNTAQLLTRIGKLPEAEKYAQDGLKLCDSGKDQRNRAILINVLASVARAKGQLSESIKYMEEYAQLLETNEDEVQYFTALRTLGAYQNQLGRISDSNKTYEKLIARTANPPDPDYLMVAHLGLADNFDKQGNITGAREHYAAALEQAKDAESKKEYVQCLNGLGAVEADLEHFDQAEKYHQEALAFAIKEGNLPAQLQSYVQLSSDYLFQGKPEKALEIIQEAEKKSVNQPDPILRGQVLTVLGRSFKELGQKDAALGYYKEALKCYQAGHRPDLQATALNSLATVYLDDHDLVMFDQLYKQAKEIYSGYGDKHEEARLEYTLGQSKLIQNKPQEAIPIYQGALEKVADTGDTGMQSAILRGLGLAYFLTNDYQHSLDAQLKAIKTAGQSSSLDTQWSGNLGVGKAYKALGQYDKAEPYLKRAVAIVEQERSNLTRDSFKTYNLDLRRDCFFELVDLMALTNRPYDAIEIAERGKSRAFLDMLANRTQRTIDTAFAAPPAGLQPNKSNAAPPVLVASADIGTRSVNVTGRPNEIIEETALSPENATPPTISEIKETVQKRGSTCVEYLPIRDRLYAWVLAPDGSIFMPPPITLNRDFYKKLAETLTTITANAKTQDEIHALGLKRQQLLHSLYDTLIKPIEAKLPADKNAMVTIIPYGPLFSVPFAALMGSDGSYFVEKHTLSYAPAIGVLRATQKIADAGTDDTHNLLAFGNPITQQIAFLGSLPYAEKEVKNIASLFPAGNATVEVGAAATKKRFQELVSHASDVHLATHGLVDEERPMRSALVLAPTPSDDGLLTVSDIITMKNLKANLVVLSACQTGRGKITGDGVVGLSRAFIIAGTPSVLVSQWNVDDIMTEYQMSKFYNAYLKGTDKGHSLRDAQLSTIAALENRHEGDSIADPNFVRANPRLWAAFQLIGESK